MGMTIRMDAEAFKAACQAKAEELHRATRPAAQAGAQVIYERARLHAPVSAQPHYFHIRGKKYGPYAPGNLRDAIYQAYSRDKSYADVSTYHVSWNAQKAPYGGMVEFGTRNVPAHSFIGRAVTETRAQVRAVIKERYLKELE